MNIFKDLSKRIIMSILTIGIVSFLIFFSQENIFKFFFTVVIIILAIMAVNEYLFFLKKKNYFLPKKTLLIGSIFLILAFFGYSQTIILNLAPILVSFFIVIIIFILNFKKIENSTASVALASFPIFYIVIPLGLIFPILYLKTQDGRLWIAYLLIVTKMTDIGAYIGGNLLGKHILCKKISPNKTKEGAIIGLLIAVGSSLFLSFFFNKHFNMYFSLNTISAIFLGIILGCGAQIGDLAESLLKRDAKVKNSGKIPGFGGILDLLDSLIFNIFILVFFLGATSRFL